MTKLVKTLKIDARRTFIALITSLIRLRYAIYARRVQLCHNYEAAAVGFAFARFFRRSFDFRRAPLVAVLLSVDSKKIQLLESELHLLESINKI